MPEQLSLLDIPNLHFKGESYNPLFDCERLSRQQRAVLDLMKDERWRTLRDIANDTGEPEASISARLRDVNNHPYLQQFFVMESKRDEANPKSGRWHYRVTRRR